MRHILRDEDTDKLSKKITELWNEIVHVIVEDDYNMRDMDIWLSVSPGLYSSNRDEWVDGCGHSACLKVAVYNGNGYSEHFLTYIALEPTPKTNEAKG